MKIKFFFCFLVFNTSYLLGQDVVFLQSNQSQMASSPALAGSNCSPQLTLLHRVQGQQPYYEINNLKNYLLGFEHSFTFKSGAKVGYGFQSILNQAGESKFGTFVNGIVLNYQHPIKNTPTLQQKLSVGINPNFSKMCISQQDLRWPSQITEQGFDPGNPGETISNFNIFDLASGIALETKYKSSQLFIGMNGYHLNKPKISFSNANIRAEIRYAIFAYGSITLNDHFDLRPGFLFTKQNVSQLYIAKSNVAWKPKKDGTAFLLGGGKASNSFFMEGGLGFKKLNLMLSYQHYKTLQSINYSALEMSVAYSFAHCK